MADVFISYRSLRVPAVRHLHRVLQAYGYSVWFDYALLSGEEFAPVIERELRDAKAAIVVWCQYSRDSRWVREEASLAQSLKTYLPVLMDPGDPPFGFRLDDTVDLTTWDGDPQSDRLHRLLSQIEAKTGKEAMGKVKALTELQQIWRDNNKTAWAAMPLDEQKAAEIEKRRAAAKGLALGPTAPGEAAPNNVYAPPPPPSPSPSAIRWARIEASLDPADYDDFLAVFDKAPEAFEARLHRRRLAAWAAIDQTAPEAIAAFLREPSFPALERLAQATMSRAAQARQEAFAAELERRRRAAEVARRAAEEARREAEAKAQREAEAAAARAADEKRLGPEAFRAREAARAGRPVAERGFPIPLPDVRNWPGPQMIAIPPGRFRMGAPASEKGSLDRERPTQDITIAHAFAMGSCAVTFAEWDAALAAGAKLNKPEDRGWGRGARPVIHVSWEDAQSYIAWLNQRAGLAGRKDAYRLPTEAEWEYACRAGTTTPFSFGETISTAQANHNGNYTYGSGPKGEYRQQTLPVGSFPPNPFGLYDMHGNVREWVEDCWRNSLTGQPADGAAYTTQGCSYRVNRGGSWFYGPQNLRSADRGWNAPTDRDDILGFRLARTL